MAANTVEIILAAVDKTREAFGGVTQNLKKLKSDSSNVLADLGVAAAVTALAAFGKAVIDGADNLSKLAQKTGTSVESLSLLQPIAEQSGVSVEALGKGMAKLAQNMVSAANGSGASAQAFARLGVTVKDAGGKMRPTEEVLLDLAEKFKLMPDGAAKSALAMELFGKAGVEMIPFLNQGRDGIEQLKQKFADLGLEISGDTARAAEQFNDTLDTVYQALKGMALQILQAALPAMQRLADLLVDLARNGKSLAPIITEIGTVLAAALGAKALGTLAGFAANLGKLVSIWKTVTLAAAAYGAIKFYGYSQEVARASADTERLGQAAKAGAAETALLVRAAGELNADGALSLQTQLDLAALSAQKVKQNLPGVATALGDVGKTAGAVGEQIRAALQDQVTRAGSTIKNLSGAYKQVGADILTELRGRTTEIDTAYQQQAQAAQNAATSEADAIARTTQTLLNAERDKLQAVKDAATQADAAWQQTYQAAMDLAVQAGQAEVQAAKDAGTGIEEAERSAAERVANVQRDLLTQKAAIYDQMASAYRSTVDKLVAEEQRHLQAAKNADEQRLNLKMSVEDRIRELGRRGMDEAAQAADRQKQIDEKQAQAREALAKGDYDRAKKLAEETMGLIERNASEVTKTVEEGGKKTTQVIVSQGEASTRAMGEMRESAGIADQALASLGDSHRKAGEAAGQGAETARTALEGVTREISTLREALAQQGQLAISVNTDAARQGIADLQSSLQAAEMVAKIQADTATAQASVKALQADLDNLDLLAKVEADTSQVKADIDALQTLVQNQKLNIPAAADFSAARDQLNLFATDARTALSRPTSHTHTVEANTSRAESAINKLERDTYSTHTIRVRKVAENALGGLIEPLQRFAAGGQALASATWGRMAGRVQGPGTDTSDNIPALLSPGEYVIRAASVRRFGQALFDSLNFGQLPSALMPPRAAFAAGGLVAGLPDGGSSSQGVRDSVDINLRIGSQTLPLQGSRATAQALAAALRDLSRAGLA